MAIVDVQTKTNHNGDTTINEQATAEWEARLEEATCDEQYDSIMSEYTEGDDILELLND